MTWSNEASGISDQVQHGMTGERQQDEWDIEYDTGKTKKVKTKKEEKKFNFKKHNLFQAEQDHRNFIKVNPFLLYFYIMFFYA